MLMSICFPCLTGEIKRRITTSDRLADYQRYCK